MLPKYYSKFFRNVKLSQANSANSPTKIPLIKPSEFQRSVSSSKKIIAKDLKSPLLQSPNDFSSFLKNSPISDKNLKIYKKQIEDVTNSLVNLYEILIENVTGDEVTEIFL